jgi:hypothetical protein
MDTTLMTSREIADASPVVPTLPVHRVADSTREPHLAVSTAWMDHAWDRFLAADDGHPLQSCGWAHVKATHGWQPLRLIATRDEHTTAGVQLPGRRQGRYMAVLSGSG